MTFYIYFLLNRSIRTIRWRSSIILLYTILQILFRFSSDFSSVPYHDFKELPFLSLSSTSGSSARASSLVFAAWASVPAFTFWDWKVPEFASSIAFLNWKGNQIWSLNHYYGALCIIRKQYISCISGITCLARTLIWNSDSIYDTQVFVTPCHSC